MKKNNMFTKTKFKMTLLALLFCGLFVSKTMAQDTFTWNGGTSTDWATAANWTKTGSAGTDNYPGEVSVLDFVVINDNSTPNAPIIASGTYGVTQVTITNAFGTEAGATLTINSGATLNITNNATTALIVINGGNIVNNGTLSLLSTSTSFTTGIGVGTPIQLPTAATEYSYTGLGNLNIDISAANVNNSWAINFFSSNANTTYRFNLNKATTVIKLTATNFVAAALRFSNVINFSQVIIGGTGLTVNSHLGAAGGYGGLISMAPQTKLTVDTGATLSIISLAGNKNHLISTFQTGTNPQPFTFINKGTIDLSGSTTLSGITFGIANHGNFNYSPTVGVVNFENQGTININLASTLAKGAPINVIVSGTGQGNVNILNTATGKMNLTNTQASGTELGSPIFVTNGGNVANVKLTNNGVLNFRGNNPVQGGNNGTVAIPRSSLINTGTITSNNVITNWVTSNTGSIQFVSPAGGNSFQFPFNGTFAQNNGVIKTATGNAALTSNVLRNIGSYGPNSVLEPGGSGYGLVDLGIINPTAPQGKIKLQIAGTNPGVDYDQVTVVNGGIGYAAGPAVAFTGGKGTGAAGYVTIASGVITGVTITSGGSGYNGATVAFANGGGTGATGTVTVSGGAVTGVTVTAGGSAYTAGSGTVAPTAVNFTATGGTNATATTTQSGGALTAFTVSSGGSLYTSEPTIAFTGTASRTATATAKLVSGVVTGINTELILSSLNLELPFLYTPVSATTIPIVTTSALTTITGTFASVTGLKAGWALAYTPTAVNLVYTPGATTATSWSASAANTDWTSTGNWTNGVPTVSSDVTILAGSNQPVIASNVDINSLSIASAASLSVSSGSKLAVTDAISNDGTLAIANNATLVQTNDVANSGEGTSTVARNSNALSRLDYTLWSSPVFNQSLLGFSPNTTVNRFHTYNEATNLYEDILSPGATPFTAASGYLIRMPNDAVTAPATQTFNGVFTGTINNGNITKSVAFTTSGYNLVGNPYPSTLDAEAFITANTSNIEESLYFWRKINGAGGSAYAVYNAMGSTATPSSATPNGTIQVGQGFFVKAKSGATSINFTNAMRLGTTSTQFFKTSAVSQKDRLWLNLTNANTDNSFSQMLVGYTNDAAATTGVDKFDARYFNDSQVALTSNINGNEYSIQGRPAFDASDVVALNFKTDFAGSHTIALDHFDGVFASGQDVYLNDSVAGTETDLKAGSYTFTAAAGADNSRFTLKFQKTLKAVNPDFNANTVSIVNTNGTLSITSKVEAISNVKVFNIQGRLIAELKDVKSNTATLSVLKAKSRLLIVRVQCVNKSVVIKKVLN